MAANHLLDGVAEHPGGHRIGFEHAAVGIENDHAVALVLNRVRRRDASSATVCNTARRMSFWWAMVSSRSLKSSPNRATSSCRPEAGTRAFCWPACTAFMVELIAPRRCVMLRPARRKSRESPSMVSAISPATVSRSKRFSR